MNVFYARVGYVFSFAVMAILGGLLSLPFQAQAATKVITGEILSIEVDPDNCILGTAPCSELGTINTQAQHGNDTPVLLIIQVIKPNAQPLTGLLFTDFFIDAEFSPSGGGVSKPDSIICPSCFADLGDGVYRLMIRPLVGSNWVQGTYILQMRIPVANVTLYKLFPVEVIP